MPTDSPTGQAPTTEQILAERGKIYGDFTKHAEITQTIKAVINLNNVRPDGGPKLSPNQQEALEMIAHKIGRILNGDPNYRDSWDDIAGYAKLAADRCKS